MSEDFNRRVRKVVGGAVGWGAAAAATKVVFDFAIGPLVTMIADTAKGVIEEPLLEVVEATRLAPEIRSQLGRSCIVVLGQARSGKASLLKYLQHGDPGKGWQHKRLSDSSDLDSAYQGVISVIRSSAEFWKQVIRDSRPTAVLYMMDCRSPQHHLTSQLADLKTALDGVSIRALYVLLNFSDCWSESPLLQQKMGRLVEDTLARHFSTAAPTLSPRYLRAVPVQLNPVSASWPEIANTIDHLGADLAP